MPYELSFTKHLGVADREQYINECCFGGDVVLSQLLPSLHEEFGEPQTNQEDWGWFALLSKDGVALAVDVFCDSPETGMFKVHLTSRIRRRFFGRKVADTEQLEKLRSIVVDALSQWDIATPRVIRLDAKYMPADEIC